MLFEIIIIIIIAILILGIICYYNNAPTKRVNKKLHFLLSAVVSALEQIFEIKQTKIVKKTSTKFKVNSNNVPQTNGMATKEFIKEQRNIMNRIYADGLTLREWILRRDNYTCQCCGNSTAKEPNLLLEVDHIHPVSKWGPSIPENLQTLCWKCNREKSNKEK